MNDVEQRGGRWRRAWPKIRQWLSYAFVALVVILLVVMARKLDWQEVADTLRNYSARTFWLAGIATVASYAVYCGYDVLAKYYVRHRLPIRQVVPITFVCYAFNLNLGAWVGSVALRYRLYARLGLGTAQITRVFTFSILTNWLSYMALAGVIFSMGWITPPPEWGLGTLALRLLGLGLAAVVLTYLGLCAFSRRRAWTVRGHEIVLPSLQMAALQLTIGALNWALMAAIIYLMLFQQVAYANVLGILLISSVAGVITHIPAGLGVTEAVFAGLLAGEMSQGAVVAALIGYRVVYYLVPLGAATVVYFALESRARKLRQKNAPEAEVAPKTSGP